jgi:DNA ligase-1
MKFSQFAAGLGRIEETTSRLMIVKLVADLLRGASPGERAAATHLLQAQLRPPYEGVQIGLGEKLLAKTLVVAYAAREKAVQRRFRALGDLGRVAESFASSHPHVSVSVRHVYDALLELAHTAGVGSTGRKMSRLADLLRAVGPVEAKTLVRIAQGRLRLGLGDQTILEAAALAALGDRRKKSVLEQAYNVRCDLASVVELAFAKGERALARIGPQIGIPVRPALAQRLPSARAILQRLGEAQVEPKYDGFRLQVHRDGRRVFVFSRRLENVSQMFPDLVKATCRQLKTRRAIIEGEAIAHNPETGEFLPFQVTMTRKRKTLIAETSARYPLRLFAFDLLYAGRRNYIPVPQRERTRRLREILAGGPDSTVTVTETVRVKAERKLQDYFDDMIARGLEGVVAKRLDAPYRAGARGFDWVKLKRASQSKLSDTVDLVLVGYMRGRGKRSSLGIGSLLAACYDPNHDRFRTVAKIGSGLTDVAWKELRVRLDGDATQTKPARVDSSIAADVWVEPRYVVEVLADEITRSPFHTCGKRGDNAGYALRFPRLVHGIRSDKSATDATTEREILDMYKQQWPNHAMTELRKR